MACAQCQGGTLDVSNRIQDIIADMDLRRAFESQGGALPADVGVPSRTHLSRNSSLPLVESGPYSGKVQWCTRYVEIT